MAIAGNVTVIPPKRTIGTQKKTEKVQKTRVAAYCRVSTEFEEQESRYEMQVEHYTSYIKSNSEWELVEVYADDGIGATNTAKRESFNRMIQDCRDGKIDMILTKSISRFSRNTVDCLKFTKELKNLNIAVFFEKENINTLDAKGEVLMTIMAALAQHPVLETGREGAGQPQPVPRIHQGQRRAPAVVLSVLVLRDFVPLLDGLVVDAFTLIVIGFHALYLRSLPFSRTGGRAKKERDRPDGTGINSFRSASHARRLVSYSFVTATIARATSVHRGERLWR